MSQHVVVAMSGGVDSSVAAAVLKQQGFRVTGVFLRLGTPEGVCVPEGSGSCCSAADANDARDVAARLGIPFYVLDYSEGFDTLIGDFVASYNRGRTPNPCVRCNEWLKFGRLDEFRRGMGADYLASGHYVRLAQHPTLQVPLLQPASDVTKDQSYVLFGLKRDVLDHCLFPVGDMAKTAVRAQARDLGLAVHDKPDSQDICFVPSGDYVDLIRQRTPGAVSPGKFTTTSGEVIGPHLGFQRFTIGQRKGLGIGFGQRKYVVAIRPADNTVVLGDAGDLLSSSLVADGANWHVPTPPPGQAFRAEVRIRYRHTPAPCEVEVVSHDRFRVRFDTPQSAITPGQAAVVYQDGYVLGGGWIESPQVQPCLP